MRLKSSPKGRPMVFDILRRRYVTLTPEEWVRQHFINFLITDKGYPASLMANEMELRVGEKRMRCDSVLFDTEKTPCMIMEYKAPEITITENVFRQIFAYNVLLGVRYLIMSNGLQHIVMHLDEESGKWVYLPEIPRFEELKTKAQ